MAVALKLSTTAACRVARLDRDRLNEHVAAGRFPCAPETIPGRARYFDPDDMVALWLFRELLDDGFNAAQAGKIACAVANAARLNPDANAISFVQDYEDSFGFACPANAIQVASKWDDVLSSGLDIRKVTTFRLGKIRKMIAHRTEEELSYHGPNN